MPFGSLNESGGPWVACVRWGPDLPRGRGIFGGNEAAHCKVMGHSTVQKRLNRSTYRLDEDLGGPRNHVLDGGAEPPRGRGIVSPGICQ